MKTKDHPDAPALRHENIQCLAEKLNVGSEDQLVTWETFARSNMQGRDFTFWRWFYEALKLLSQDANMKGLWHNDRICGFIQKALSENYLLQKTPGTFLLRFSDSTLGEYSSDSM